MKKPFAVFGLISHWNPGILESYSSGTLQFWNPCPSNPVFWF